MRPSEMPIMSGRRDMNDRHLVIEQNVTNGNEPSVPASGGSRNRLNERSTSGGSSNRPRLRVTVGNVRVHRTPLAGMAEPNPSATTAEVWLAGGQGCLESSGLAGRGRSGRWA